MTVTVDRRGPGRPRAEGHDEKILDAVLTLIDKDEPVTVKAVVELSGLSRAALYRRWPSVTDLVAAALDRGRVPVEIDASGDLEETIVGLLFADPDATRGRDYSERRFRKRIALVMENAELQRAYWSSHVRRRRRAMAHALHVGMERGELRADLDVDASIDAINGIFYYQLVARGTSLDDPDTVRRCRTAFEIVWRGMTSGS